MYHIKYKGYWKMVLKNFKGFLSFFTINGHGRHLGHVRLWSRSLKMVDEGLILKDVNTCTISAV